MRLLIGIMFALIGLAILGIGPGNSLKEWIGVFMLMMAGAAVIEVH